MVGEQVTRELDAFAGNVFQRGDPELFLKPAKEDIAAEVYFSAQRIHGDAFGEMVVDVLQYEVEAAAVAIAGGVFGVGMEVLALEDADQQFFETEIGIDIFGGVAARADADEFVDEACDVGVVVKVILIEMQLPAAFFVFGAMVIIVEIMDGVADIAVVYGKGDALGRGIGAGFGEVDDHGLARGDDHGFAGKVFKGGAIAEVHDLFAADHAGDHEVAEGEGDVETAFVGFEYIELTMVKIENAAIFRECLQLPVRCEGNRLKTIGRHGKACSYKGTIVL